MFGASTVCLFRDILGIKQTENSVRYDEIVIEPVFSECLDFAKGHITTPHGEIRVEWKRNDESIEIKINLCDGLKASFAYNGDVSPISTGENVFKV